MFNYATNQVWYQQMRIPASALIRSARASMRLVSSAHAKALQSDGSSSARRSTRRARVKREAGDAVERRQEQVAARGVFIAHRAQVLLRSCDSGDGRPLRQTVDAVDRASQELLHSFLENGGSRRDVSHAESAHGMTLRE
jgi:hypothetical protein